MNESMGIGIGIVGLYVAGLVVVIVQDWKRFRRVTLTVLEALFFLVVICVAVVVVLLVPAK